MGSNVQDLINKINQDMSIPERDKVQLISDLVSQYSVSTPLSQIMAGAAGTVVGVLISKYFGAGLAGTVVGGLLGASAGLRVKNIFGL